MGFPIYPEYYAENQTYHWEEQLRSGSPWYTQRSPLSWTPDGEHVVFAAAQPSGDDAEFGSTMVLVRVDLSSGIRSPQIHERELDYARLLAPDQEPTPHHRIVNFEDLERTTTEEGEPGVILRPSAARFREEVVVPLP